MRARARVDQDQVRQLPICEADLIVQGLAERVRIIRTAMLTETHSYAGALLAGGPSHPWRPT
jgi:hypothetical protein